MKDVEKEYEEVLSATTKVVRFGNFALGFILGMLLITSLYVLIEVLK